MTNPGDILEGELSQIPTAPSATGTASSVNAPRVDADIDPLLLYDKFIPAQTASGDRIPRRQFASQLEAIKVRKPLLDACSYLQVRHAKRDTLTTLRAALVRHWYDTAGPTPAQNPPVPLLHTSPPSILSSSRVSREAEVGADTEVDDDTLVQQYDVENGIGQEIFGALGSGGLEEVGEDEDEDIDDVRDLADDDAFQKYQTKVRVSAAERWEANRRAGGRKTQKSVVKSWNIFVKEALAEGKIRDEIVDEHSLLLFIDFSANRRRRDRRGEYIPNTRIGASQIKKEFFGALRIRKVQDAQDPTLATRRMATTVHVYDAVKTRMDEALRGARDGLIPADDAPDIVANTFLAALPDETLRNIRYGFLEHRELKSTINGHLAWTMMNASGNRGDDIRALRLCEMQPYDFLHPNGETSIFAVLGLQSDQEHKTRSKAMRTTINPTYTCFIAHRNPEMCPLGALAFFLHYIHDVVRIEDKYNIDYTSNKSWRAIRLIHGSSATVPYNETALQNLFVQSYKKAGVESRVKVHLARHMLGYHQEKMGVEAEQTSKLGWSRDTYQNTYAPALPKKAIIGAHGYKVHETYDPEWRKVVVPSHFLNLVCPQAEDNVMLVDGRENLVGVTNYWKMIIKLRPYLFQTAAAIYQVRPNSSLFRLPALANPDVVQWMKSTFPIQLQLANEMHGDAVSLERIQNEVIRQSLEQIRYHSTLQNDAIQDLKRTVSELASCLQRRTAQWTPAKAISLQQGENGVRAPLQAVARQLVFDNPIASETRSASGLTPEFSNVLGEPFCEDTGSNREAEDTGMYFAEDQSLRGFIVPSPHSCSPRPRTKVDLVLPPLIAFRAPGEDLLPTEPIFGQDSVQWMEVFAKIKQTEPLWDVWCPSKSLDEMSVKYIWDCYNLGEAVYDSDGHQTGLKPPLRLVEQHFQSRWRQNASARKRWQRFREIPEWIDNEITHRGVSITDAVQELEEKRKVEGKSTLLSINALSTLLASQRKETARNSQPVGSSAGCELVPIDSNDGKRRRAPTIGGRPKPKRSRPSEISK